jgi:SSS family transporter
MIWIPVLIIAYFLLLLFIAKLTSGTGKNKDFYVGGKKSPWYIVAFGMIGTSLSGITFISVPGTVLEKSFSYMQMVLGYFFGYMVISFVLLPLYYRLNIDSIYEYLKTRYGFYTYKTGASLFLISRTIGASLRLFLVALVFDQVIFPLLGWDLPYWLTVFITIVLIWVYTFKGGIKTIIWTDTLQTFFMLLSLFLTLYLVSQTMNLSLVEIWKHMEDKGYSKVFFIHNVNSPLFFWKQFIAGMLITITMTGLDQDMMQKNLSCKNLNDAQKNMFWFSIILMIVNFSFLMLGGVLYLYAESKQLSLPERSDLLFPSVALAGDLPVYVSILFVLGLIAAAYSSADSALTSLTTSFTIDIMDGRRLNEYEQKKMRIKVHILMSAILFLTILSLKFISKKDVISQLFHISGFTYGPLLTLYGLGMFTKIQFHDKIIPFLVILSPLITFLIKKNEKLLFGSYQIGFELILVNAFILCVFMLIFGIRKKKWVI